VTGKVAEREPSLARSGSGSEAAPQKPNRALRQSEHAASQGRLALRRTETDAILVVRNRQRARPLNTKFLRDIVHSVLIDEISCDDFEIGISIINEPAMTRMNEGYLRHKGSTDVITFDYSDTSRPRCLTGEIFVCLDEALLQAPRFQVTWQNELVRYIVHGILHLSGFNDKTAVARRKMKSEENRLMRHLALRFKLDRLKAAPRRGKIAAK
jgi:rRNA maturation RNase YbeY